MEALSVAESLKAAMSRVALEGVPNQLSGFGLAALAYSQELGWRVFPCAQRGKEPLVPKASGGKGCRDASTHPEQVSSWWDRWPNANIGIATGGASGLLVVDVDGAAGEEALARWGPLPRTPEVRTAKGRHLYFQAPKAAQISTTRRLGDQLDTRGDGGYVIAPPSMHAAGHQYTWKLGSSPQDVPVASLPEPMAAALIDSRVLRPAGHLTAPQASVTLDAMGQRRDLQRLRAWLARVPSRLRHGEGRNDIAYRIAARAMEALSESETIALLEAWNSENVEPLSPRALERIALNARLYARGRAA